MNETSNAKRMSFVEYSILYSLLYDLKNQANQTKEISLCIDKLIEVCRTAGRE